MSIIKKAHKQSSLDARRFGKSIVCRPIMGESIVKFLLMHQLVPVGMIFPDLRIAYATNRNRMFAIPVYNYEDMLELAASAGIASARPDMQAVPSTSLVTADTNLSSQIAKIQREEQFVNFIKQNMIMVAMSHTTIPKGILQLITIYDILIDSVDVSQAIGGEYIYRNNKHTNEYRSWKE